MFKRKHGAFIKAAAAAVLSIGLFSAAFIGINTLALASATGNTEIISPVTSAISASVERQPISTPAEDAAEYQSPTLTVYEADNEWYTPSANALSAEEAAEVGARYIWDVFGESIDGKFVSLFYSHHPSGTRAYWCGMVADSADAFANDRSLYWFTVCAISGEGIDIGQFLVGDRESSLEIRELMMQGVISQEPVIDDTQLELSAKIASEYAQRHFSNSTVVSVELQRATPNAIDRDSDGNVFVTDYFLTFSITDSTGREAEVSILMESEQLGWIMTQHNDIIPGYNYDAPGGIG